jgi:type III HopJ-like effector protein
MNLSEFLDKLNSEPESIEFTDTISIIESTYDYSPCAFSNGSVENDAGQNEGSCKIFAFAKLNHLSEEQTLHCFGKYYREEVLQDPDGDSHQNIRQFIESGWSGINFNNEPLVERN